jgi:hypothetical protein
VGPQEFLLEWRYAASPGVEMPGMVWGTSKFRFKSPVTCIPQAPGVGAAATGYTTKNDRNSNLFIHFISILLLPKKANSSRVAVLPSCACTGPLRKSQHFTTAVGRLCIRSAWNGAA